MPEIYKNHGEEYLEHIFNIAKLNDPIKTSSGNIFYIATARTETVEAKNALKVRSKTHLAIVAVAFSPKGEFLKAKVLEERISRDFVLILKDFGESIHNESFSQRPNWIKLNEEARIWAQGLDLS